MNLAGVHLTWPMAAAGAAAAQWMVVALAGVIAPVRMRKTLAVSTAAFAAAWIYAFNATPVAARNNDVAQAAMIQGEGQKHNGSCASIRNGMSVYDVRLKLGSPDETRSDDIIRGPGSTTLIYRDIRCAVHLFDDKVDLVD